MALYIAREHLYELNEHGEPFRLLVPTGDPVSDEQIKLLGLDKRSAKLEKIEAAAEPEEG